MFWTSNKKKFSQVRKELEDALNKVKTQEKIISCMKETISEQNYALSKFERKRGKNGRFISDRA